MQGQCPKCKGIMEMQPEWIGRQAQCPYCKELFIVQGAMNPMQYQAPNPPNAYNQGQHFYPQNSNPQNAYNQGHQFTASDDNIANVEAFGCYLKVLKHYADFFRSGITKRVLVFRSFQFHYRFWHWILECFDGSREHIGIALHVGNSHPINSCWYKKLA